MEQEDVRRAQRLGVYKNMEDHRIKAGLEISDLVALLGDGGPKERSLRRLESGEGIRLPNVYRIFNLINQKLGGKLNAAEEIVETNH